MLRRLVWGNALVSLGLMLCLLALLNFLAAAHRVAWDLTREGLHTLSPQTRKVLRTLGRTVHVTAFFQQGSPEEERFRQLVDAYRRRCRHLEVEFVDPDRHPALAKRYGVVRYGTVVLECGDKQVSITALTEEELTNALLRVTAKERPLVCFLSGHGEHGLEDEGREGYSTLRRALRGQGFEVRELVLAREGRVPPGCRVLVIAGPQRPPLRAELRALRAYLREKGGLVLLLDPGAPKEFEGLVPGVRFGSGVVIDTLSRAVGGDYAIPVVTEYTSHPIVRDFRLATFFPLARPVEPAPEVPQGVTVEALARTSPHSWEEHDLKGRQVSFDPGRDRRGPLPLAVAVSGKARAVVVGDSDFASNAYYYLSGNGDLLLNAIAWLARQEKLIAIRPRRPTFSPLYLRPDQLRVLFACLVMLPPLLAAAAGAGVWWRRRSL